MAGARLAVLQSWAETSAGKFQINSVRASLPLVTPARRPGSWSAGPFLVRALIVVLRTHRINPQTIRLACPTDAHAACTLAGGENGAKRVYGRTPAASSCVKAHSARGPGILSEGPELLWRRHPACRGALSEAGWKPDRSPAFPVLGGFDEAKRPAWQARRTRPRRARARGQYCARGAVQRRSGPEPRTLSPEAGLHFRGRRRLNASRARGLSDR
jgi:hypothetical protein